MAIHHRYPMLAAFSTLLLVACSSNATDPVALSPDSLTSAPETASLVTAEQSEEELLLSNGTTRGDFRDNVLNGTPMDDQIRAGAGDDIIDGQAGADQIATNRGEDAVVYTPTQLGSGPDQLSDWLTDEDRFLLDASGLGVTGDLAFVNALAADLPTGDVNVIVLQDSDDDNDPNTVFNARSAARLIGAQIQTPGPGFFVYFNSGLGVNRLVFSEDLADGEANFSVLAAINTISEQAAIDELPQFSAANFSFMNDSDIGGGLLGNEIFGTDLDDVINGRTGRDRIDGRAGADQIATGLGRDTVVYTETQLLSSPDQLSDWQVRADQFALLASDFGVKGDLSFINARATDLPTGGVNVIVLQDSDDDNDPDTVFNARSAARLIGAQIETPGPGFFVYFNSGLGVNRLVVTEDLSDGEASFTVLAAINSDVDQAAIRTLRRYSEANFSFF